MNKMNNNLSITLLYMRSEGRSIFLALSYQSRIAFKESQTKQPVVREIILSVYLRFYDSLKL